MLTRFLYRNNVEVVKLGYIAKQLSQTARKGCHRIIDIVKLAVTSAHVRCCPYALLQNFSIMN